MPQPLLKKYYSSELNIGSHDDSPSNHRPKLALLAMSVIAEWSILDSMLNGLFVKLLGNSAKLGAAMYQSAVGGAARRAAFKAAAKIQLNDDEFEVFEAIMSLTSTARKERNTIAHGVWGYCPEITDGVLLIDADDLFDMDVATVHENATKDTFSSSDFPVEKLLIYKEADFMEISTRIRRLMSFVGEFRVITSPTPGRALDGQELERLSSAPEFQTKLSPRRRLQRNQPK